MFGREEPVAEEKAGCHICGEGGEYHCDVCGELMCLEHTVIGTATCTECRARRAA